MATMDLAQVQSILASLIASYASLAATPIHSYSLNQRSVVRHKLAELRQEIMEWSAVEQDCGGNTGTIALASFGDPV